MSVFENKKHHQKLINIVNEQTSAYYNTNKLV